jgi:hypothetical protein
MHSLSKRVGIGFLTLVCGLTFSIAVLAADRAVYDKPDVEVPGTTIYGKVVKVMERDAAKHAWQVSVENVATGEVVQLHLDKTTERKEKDPDPAIGDKVVVKYDDKSKHALTFVHDTSTQPIKP